VYDDLQALDLNISEIYAIRHSSGMFYLGLNNIGQNRAFHQNIVLLLIMLFFIVLFSDNDKTILCTSNKVFFF